MIYENEKINPFILPHEYYIPEIWTPITEFAIPGIQPWYTISNYGNIYSFQFQKLLTPTINNNGYFLVTVRLKDNSGIGILIHRTMMISFCPVHNYKELYVNHRDCNKLNNRLWNLEWTTPTGNNRHALENGLIRKYKEDGTERFLMTEETAHKICKMLESQKYTNTEIAEIIGCHVSAVNHISAGNSWTDVSYQYKIQHRQSNKFTNEEYNKVCKYLKIHADDQIAKAQLIKDTLFYALKGKEYNKSNYDVVNYIIKTKKYLNN